MGISRNFSIFNKSNIPSETDVLTNNNAISTISVNCLSDGSFQNNTEHCDQSSTSSTKEILSPSSMDNDGFPLLDIHENAPSPKLDESVFEADQTNEEENVFENAFKNHLDNETDLQIVDTSNRDISADVNSNINSTGNSDVESNSGSKLNSIHIETNQSLPMDEQISNDNSALENARWTHATKVYDKTLRKINIFYTSTRRQMTLRRRIKKSRRTKYGECSLPSFNSDVILSNNGLGIDKSRDRKLGIPPLGMNLFNIVETEGITNMVSTNDIHSKLQNKRRAKGTKKPRPMSYKFSVSELFTEDNIICEEEEEEDDTNDVCYSDNNNSINNNQIISNTDIDDDATNDNNCSINDQTSRYDESYDSSGVNTRGNCRHSYENDCFEEIIEDDGENPFKRVDFV